MMLHISEEYRIDLEYMDWFVSRRKPLFSRSCLQHKCEDYKDWRNWKDDSFIGKENKCRRCGKEVSQEILDKFNMVYCSRKLA